MAAWTDDLLLKVVNILTYVFLFGSNTYASTQPNFGGKTSHITPAPYAFYVWTIINLLLLGYVILQFSAAGYEPICQGVRWRFAGVAILNAIFAHLYAANHTIAAFIISLLLAMVISHIYYTLRQTPAKSGAATLFVHLPFSLWHAWSVVLVIISGFAAFGKSEARKAGVFTDVFVCIALAFLASTSVGYAFESAQGDVAGAAVIAWTLLGIFSEQRHPLIIHWFALGAFIVSAVAVVKALVFAFRKDGSILANDGERAPLVGGSN